MSTYLSERTGVRARKQHRCFLCGEPICQNSEYDRRTGVERGEILTMAMHPECNEASSDWDDADWETFERGSLCRGVDAPREG